MAPADPPPPDDSPPTEIAAWLASPQADEALASARAAVAEASGNPLRAGTLLRSRHPELDVARAAAVLEQATLRQLARERYAITGDMLLTRDGLEAATRPEVAARRARLLAASGARRVLDLTGGLGMDDAAFLAAGLDVTTVERDPATAAYLARNCRSARVIVADSTDPATLTRLLDALGPLDVVFVDPARRDARAARDLATGRARPERDPERWSPAWSTVAGIAHPRVAAKVAPGFRPPPGWEAEWVSVDRVVVECSVYSWRISGVDARAVIIRDEEVTTVAADPQAAVPVADEIGTWLHEPDPAVLRAGALPALAAAEDAAPVDPDSSWLTGTVSSSHPGLRSYLVLAELTGSSRRQRSQLASVTRAVAKTKDVDADPRAVLRSLGLREGPGHVIVQTRRAGRVVTLLTQPAAAGSS